MASTAAERYAALVSWVESAGGQLHPSVEIYNDEHTEGSLRVKPNHSISSCDSIVKLPLTRSLSFLNAISGHPDFPAAATLGVATPSSSSSSSTYLPTEFLKNTPPHVIGRFFLIQQYLLGPESQWAPYISTLPQPGDPQGLLPCAWPAADVEFLRGTNAWIAVQEINATLATEYDAAIPLLSSDTFPDTVKYTKDLYVWAYCIFASRSFRQSLTIPAATALSLVAKADDFSVLLPLFDMGNHHPQAKTQWKTPSSSPATEDNEETKFCELQVGQPYRAGEQVFNNYGNKTNAELLLGYGFILAEGDEFHNDYIHVKTRPSRLVLQSQQKSQSQSQSQSQPHSQGNEHGDTRETTTAAAAAAHELSQTHLVSLRPIADPSSLAGRARLLNPDPKAILSCYIHVQDTLVASLYEAICQARGLPLITSGRVTIEDILAGNAPAVASPEAGERGEGGEEDGVEEDDLTDEIINALGTKLSIDLETLEQAEAALMMGGSEGGGGKPRNGNQELAVLYRTQCKKVLENALGSLGGDDGEDEMDEDEE